MSENNVVKIFVPSFLELEINNLYLDIEPKFIGTIKNVTYPAGKEAVLACTVRNLGSNKVGWLRASDQTVLALQGRVVTHNARISVTQENFHTWKIIISKLRESDKGCYMCQINTSPMKKQIGCIDVQAEQTLQFLNILVPKLKGGQKSLDVVRLKRQRLAGHYCAL